MTLRRNALVAVALVGVLVAAGCGQASPAAAPTQAPAAPKAVEPTKAPAAPAAPTKAPAAPTKAPEPAKKVDFPQKGKAITLIVPFAAGGPSDVMARLIAPALEKELGTPVEVVNKPGAASQVGVTELARSKPDGYTMVTANFPGVPILYMDPDRKAAFGRKDLMPLAVTARDANLFAVQTSSPFQSLKDLVDAARARPNELVMGTTGLQSSPHLAAARFEKLAGLQFRYVHFEGGAPGVTGLLGGHSQALVTTVNPTLVSGVKAGNLRVVGLMDRQPHPNLPGAKTLIEQGFDMTDYNTFTWLLPAGVPKDVVDVLSAAFKKVAESPDYRKKMEEAGTSPYYMDPAQFAAFWDEIEPQVGPFIDVMKRDQK